MSSTKQITLFQVRSLAQIALLAAVLVVGRWLFSPIPNVQPMTVLLILVAKRWPLSASLTLVAISVIVSNLLLGMGPWTWMQIVSLGSVVALAKALTPISQRLVSGQWQDRLFWVLFAGFSGYLFGFIISFLWVVILPGLSFLTYYLQGLMFDSLHAIGNVGFYLLLEPIMTPLLQRYPIKKNK